MGPTDPVERPGDPPRPAGAVGAARSLVEVDGLSVRFGGILALDRVSFAIREGERLGLIGPNGAGKTTLFNCLSRIYVPSAGDIRFAGRSILRTPPHAMARLGIGRTFQNLALFGRLSVLENVIVGGYAAARGHLLADVLALPSARAAERAARAEALGLIAQLGLADCADRAVNDLPFGTRKRVELARALMSRPRLLLLDEPAAGLNHAEVFALADLIRELRDERGLTVLLVEHHMGLVMSVSDRVVALNFGRKIAEGRPEDVKRDPAVVEAYLGSDVASEAA